MKTCQVYPDGDGILLDTPFIAEFVAALKDEVPARRRRWVKSVKMWWVDGTWADTAISIAEQFYTVKIVAGRGQQSQPADSTTADAWAALWLVPGAPPELVRVAYRTLARLHHPDHVAAVEIMKRVNCAYEQLLELAR